MGRHSGPSAIALAFILATISGCILGNRPDFVYTGHDRDEMTFYLDGAGNLGFGKETVPLGLADGGYEGSVQHFIWTTYLGPIHDQVGLSHNHRKARELARQIEAHLDLHPSGKVNLIALSAGTGVALFALEDLDMRYRVENVVMLSSSLSANYNLTRALRRVRGGMYFFYSIHDPILNNVIPIVGTVDRAESGVLVAGEVGAGAPVGSSYETLRLYTERVHNVQWEPDSIAGPIKYWHAGSSSRAVIRDLVAPIIVGKAGTQTKLARAQSTVPSSRTVRVTTSSSYRREEPPPPGQRRTMTGTVGDSDNDPSRVPKVKEDSPPEEPSDVP